MCVFKSCGFLCLEMVIVSVIDLLGIVLSSLFLVLHIAVEGCCIFENARS